MMARDELVTILMADDDEDDILLTQSALEESHLNNPFFAVRDGEELMDYLLRRNDYSSYTEKPLPGLILLDLNMPKKDGREALEEIKRHEHLRHIPIIIMTTSEAEEDILKSYNLGAASFIVKPITFEGLVKVINVLGMYWFEIVRRSPGDAAE
jgi:CheY-like chemotaxis protein